MAQATTSANGAEALYLLLENDPVDYIITDYKMPVMDSFQFLNTYQVIKDFLKGENTMYIYWKPVLLILAQQGAQGIGELWK